VLLIRREDSATTPMSLGGAATTVESAKEGAAAAGAVGTAIRTALNGDCTEDPRRLVASVAMTATAAILTPATHAAHPLSTSRSDVHHLNIVGMQLTVVQQEMKRKTGRKGQA